MKMVKILKTSFLVLAFFPQFLLSADIQSLKGSDHLALPVEINESEYGSGPLLHPGRTFYVSVKGDDNGDGLAWDTAWRSLKHGVSRLMPGDTLLIGEGEYIEPGLAIKCSGEAGRPITISSAPGHRVLISGFVHPGPLEKTPGTSCTYEVSHKLPAGTSPESAGVWEEPAFIKLENAGTLKRVEELPGTFFCDGKEGKIYVRFSDSGGPEKNRLAVTPQKVSGRRDIYQQPGRASVELTGSYVCLRGLHFRGGFAALAVFECSNSTVEECSFFATDYAGLSLWRRTNRLLISNNYAIRNGIRGGIILDKTGRPQNVDSDTLIIGNRVDSSAPTQRTAGVPVYFAIRSYGWPGHRNHVINNIMNEPEGGAFRWRGASPAGIFQGNVLTGYFHALNWYGDFAQDGSERIIVRNNTMLGGTRVQNFSMDPSGPGGNWAAADIAFYNNIVGDRKKTARFADPGNLDYRLQSDSPLAGKAIGGGNPGAFFRQDGRIFYVSPSGVDSSSGTSERLAFRTLSKACGVLRAGDTLYVSEGVYQEPLAVRSSGNPGNPIMLRAFGRKKAVVPSVLLEGSNITVQGFTVSGSGQDAVSVRGDNVSLERCAVYGNRGAGVRASSARNLSVTACTIAENLAGICLEGDSAGAIVRDNIFADNAEGSVSISAGSEHGYLASHNAYHVSEKGVPEREWKSVKGDLMFLDAPGKDYRVRKESPAGNLALFSEAAGAYPAVDRDPVIEGIRTVGRRNDSIAVAWETPMDDSTGYVRYRLQGEEKWSEVFTQKSLQGTFHHAGLAGLAPGSRYEYVVVAQGRRGGRSESPVLGFSTAENAYEPAVFYVNPGGNDMSDGRTPGTSWKTIRRANSEAGPGDTVLISPGEYIHPVSPLFGGRPGKRITYRKNGRGNVIINGYKVNGPLLLLDSRSYVTIDGLAFINSVDSVANVASINDSTGTEIINCFFGGRESTRDTLFAKAVTVSGSPDMRFEGNVVWGTRYHFVAGSSPGLLVKNNTFVDGEVYSILIGSGTRVRLINNIIYSPTSVARNPGVVFRLEGTEVESDYNLFCMPSRQDTVIGGIAEIEVYNKKTTNWDASVAGRTLEEWQKNSGQDKNSIVADPMFRDMKNGDFSLLPGSPAIGKGAGGVNIGAANPPSPMWF